MKEWNRKNAIWMVLYAVLYAVGTAIVCVTGAITPVLFVCYQITAGVILSGIVVYAFRKVQAPGVATCLGLALIVLLNVIGDAVAWHVIPIIVIAVLAEAIRAIFKYDWAGDVIGTVIMTFSSFGYYGQIWFNRDYTYECAVEEMPAGYAKGLMAESPMWSLIVVVIAGAVLSVVISNVTAKLFQFDKKRGEGRCDLDM